MRQRGCPLEPQMRTSSSSAAGEVALASSASACATGAAAATDTAAASDAVRLSGARGLSGGRGETPAERGVRGLSPVGPNGSASSAGICQEGSVF